MRTTMETFFILSNQLDKYNLMMHSELNISFCNYYVETEENRIKLLNFSGLSTSRVRQKYRSSIALNLTNIYRETA